MFFPVPGDEYWSYVSLSAPMTGTNGSQTFTDYSQYGHTLAQYVVKPVISTAQSKFGEGSCYFDGNQDSLEISSHSSLTLSTSNFCVELFVYPLAYGGTSAGTQFYGTTRGVTTGYSFNLGQDQDSLRLMSDTSGSWADDLTVSAGGGPALNEWTHLALVREGSNLTIYKNGVSVATRADFTARNLTAYAISIGRYNSGSYNRDYYGYMNHLRMTKGVPRYTGNFTAPDGFFPRRAHRVEFTPIVQQPFLMHAQARQGW